MKTLPHGTVSILVTAHRSDGVAAGAAAGAATGAAVGTTASANAGSATGAAVAVSAGSAMAAETGSEASRDAGGADCSGASGTAETLAALPLLDAVEVGVVAGRDAGARRLMIGDGDGAADTDADGCDL